jgi:hypothetical protein
MSCKRRIISNTAKKTEHRYPGISKTYAIQSSCSRKKTGPQKWGRKGRNMWYLNKL